MRWRQFVAALAAVVAIAASEGTAVRDVLASAEESGTTGGGKFLLLNTIDASFNFNAVQTGDGGAAGNFFQSFIFQGQLVEFRGRVTCFSVDTDNHRAWIGGVVTVNNSTHPNFTTPRTQPGRDVWFRVLDGGEGLGADADRTTIYGFEGDRGILTSEQYCAARLWLDGNANTWPVTDGNIQVR